MAGLSVHPWPSMSMATNQKWSACGPKFLEYASAWPPTPCSAKTSGLEGSPDSMQRVRIPPASMKCCLKEIPLRSAQTLEKLSGLLSLMAESLWFVIVADEERSGELFCDQIC